MVEGYSPITANWNGMLIPELARLDSFLATVQPRGLLILARNHSRSAAKRGCRQGWRGASGCQGR